LRIITRGTKKKQKKKTLSPEIQQKPETTVAEDSWFLRSKSKIKKYGFNLTRLFIGL